MFPVPAFANESTPSVEPTSTATPTPEPSSTLEWDQNPVPGSESWGQPPRTLGTVFHISGGPYTPPAEASLGPGGWAVVHPGTGVVHGVIVGTIETYWANNGRMQIEYMGCPAGCLLRFQTRATADGNVAGWHGPEVTYNKSDQTFNLGYTSQNSNGTTIVRQKLIPEKTATDGINLGTGLIDIRSEFISTQVNGFVVKLLKLQETFESEDQSVVEFSDWQTFTYRNSAELNQNLETDVDTALAADGYQTDEPVEGGFVDTVRKLTGKITRFFGGIFSAE